MAMDTISAAKLTTPLDFQGLPNASAWAGAPKVSFCSDWRGENPDPERKTVVQILWSPDRLFFRFHCSYRTLFAYEEGSGRRDELWLRDVAEVFLRPESENPGHYREFEISPNGAWLDLDISPGKKSVLFCDLKTRVVLGPRRRIWTADIGIPMECLAEPFDPGGLWRLNLFRIEGEEPNRFYSAWRPTRTPRPNFHVPEAFGALRFRQ